MQEQATSSIAASSLPSSSERSSSSALNAEVKEGMESDDEIRRVPEMGAEAAGTTTSGRDGGLLAGPAQPSAAGSKRRGRSPADKENKRLKRLLRNRVSAQQARERKKAYLIDLEARVKELETKNAELEERLSTLQNENQMLRQERKREESRNVMFRWVDSVELASSPVDDGVQTLMEDMRDEPGSRPFPKAKMAGYNTTRFLLICLVSLH
ncbi:hypothetical protein SASPL_119216 [Salvia splendens]|uniref:Transcription factor HY5 n=1 Tax=Salvia splendens TaxID=180675 RepID=A0A8X8XMZ9_SALSN|nr:hypothetical protein SASPL_119216 [Salvia splendens]